MKARLHLLFTALAWVALLSINCKLSTCDAQGTAFTYQGSLSDGGNPASGVYDLQFTIYDAATNGNIMAGPFTNAATAVNAGLFLVTLDPGTGAFPGAARWLEIGVRTNGSAVAFSVLFPYQQITASPYAITASNLTGLLPASQLSGTIANAQLTNSAVTVNTGTGLTGGGIVSLGGTITLSSTGVLSVTANTPLSSSGGQNPNLTLGNIPDALLSANLARLNGANLFTGSNNFSGVLIATNIHNSFTIENRSSDPPNPVPGQIWLITP